MSDTFADFLRRWVNEFGTISALAGHIGMNQSRLTQILNKGGSLNVLNCLNLAKATGESPGTVLRLAGKDAEAALIEELYLDGGTPVSRKDRERLEQFHAMPADARLAIDKVVDVVLEKEAKRSLKTGSSRRRQRTGTTRRA